MRTTWLILFVIMAGSSGTAHAQTINGEIGIYSRYVDDDLFVYTNEPVVQAAAYLNVSDRCSIDAWGSHGIATKVGGELDLGASCRFSVADKTELEVAVVRNFLQGTPDLTALTASVKRGAFDITVDHYLWDHNPDATRVVTGITLKANEAFSLRPHVVYETGFGEPDILVGGLSMEYAISDRFALVGTALHPLVKGDGDTRTTQAIVGVRFAF